MVKTVLKVSSEKWTGFWNIDLYIESIISLFENVQNSKKSPTEQSFRIRCSSQAVSQYKSHVIDASSISSWALPSWVRSYFFLDLPLDAFFAFLGSGSGSAYFASRWAKKLFISLARSAPEKGNKNLIFFPMWGRVRGIHLSLAGHFVWRIDNPSPDIWNSRQTFHSEMSGEYQIFRWTFCPARSHSFTGHFQNSPDMSGESGEFFVLWCGGWGGAPVRHIWLPSGRRSCPFL